MKVKLKYDMSTSEINAYKRTFESMGRGLLLIRIDNINRKQIPYHYFLENGRKPPLDVAIDKECGEVSYINYFFQDEKMYLNQIDMVLEYKDGLPIFDTNMFSDRRYQIFEEADFQNKISKSDLLVALNYAKHANAYQLYEDIFLLFNNSNEFLGFLLKNLNDGEVQELIKSEIL